MDHLCNYWNRLLWEWDCHLSSALARDSVFKSCRCNLNHQVRYAALLHFQIQLAATKHQCLTSKNGCPIKRTGKELLPFEGETHFPSVMKVVFFILLCSGPAACRIAVPSRTSSFRQALVPYHGSKSCRLPEATAGRPQNASVSAHTWLSVRAHAWLSGPFNLGLE